MNYLFFDIECACVYKDVAKICAFGYCLCDEQFNIIKKQDILINPNGKFHLTAHGGDGIVLPYDYDEFKKHPDFPAYYQEIKTLLEDKNNLPIGHATINDVRYLNLETKRYKLPSFEFNFADTQIIYMAMSKTFDRQTGLDKLTELFNIHFKAHCAADDAYATMKVAEQMCKEENCAFSELLEKYEIKLGKISNYLFKNCSSKSGDEYYEKRAKEKEEKSVARANFNNFVCRSRIRYETRELYGKRFVFARNIEEDLQLSKKLIREIWRRGGRYSLRLTGANIYVIDGEDDSVRTVSAKKMQEEGAIQIMQLSKLNETLGFDK